MSDHPPTAPLEAQRVVRRMARALGRNGLSGPFGHCSLRLDAAHFLVCAPRPMALIGVDEPGTVVPVAGPLPESVLGEVRLHQQVYARRSGVQAVCRFISPSVTALAALGRTPRPRHGNGAYFAPGVPFWTSSALVRDDPSAVAVASLMGDGPAIVLNVNGAVTAGSSPEQALTLAWFLEDAARVELAVLAAGQAEGSHLLLGDEAAVRATWQGRIAERVWEFLTRDDPEA
ncbi:class II aldolase/adducin family protein [Zoogloea sp.]|uniref:class II aldolase/adducin family protein n=1 Tax=Zoogloea sp. TaxID=49181 RepID=UPI0014161A2E|nr:MAG: class II aldolase/adducin family protein [Zoogloea sp.]